MTCSTCNEARERLLVEFVSEYERDHSNISEQPLSVAVDRAVGHHIQHHAEAVAQRGEIVKLTGMLQDALERLVAQEGGAP
jgi:hypothetical protein